MRRAIVLGAVALLALIACQGSAFARRPIDGFGVDGVGRATIMVPTTRSSTPVVVRVTSTGVLDESFASGGVLRPALAGRSAKLSVQRDGSLIVGGDVGRKVILRRYRPNGSADRSFAGHGAALLTYGGPMEGILRQPGGQIIALATRSCSPDSCGYLYRNLLVHRFSPTGKLLHRYLLSEESWGLLGVGMDPRGGFVIAGNVWDLERSTYDRFRPTGAFANSIHRDISLQLSSEEREEEVEAGVSSLAIDGKGGLVIATNWGAELWRRNPNGSADFSFGDRGRALCGLLPGSKDLFAPAPAFQALEITAAGKLVAAGGPGECSLVRYLADGKPDPSFDGDGKVNVEAGGMPPPQALALLPDGGVIVAGWHAGTKSIRLARYTAEGALDRAFGDGGVASVPVSAPG